MRNRQCLCGFAGLAYLCTDLPWFALRRRYNRRNRLQTAHKFQWLRAMWLYKQPRSPMQKTLGNLASKF
jgi:hypothetical protein